MTSPDPANRIHQKVAGMRVRLSLTHDEMKKHNPRTFHLHMKPNVSFELSPKPRVRNSTNSQFKTPAPTSTTPRSNRTTPRRHKPTTPQDAFRLHNDRIRRKIESQAMGAQQLRRLSTQTSLAPPFPMSPTSTLRRLRSETSSFVSWESASSVGDLDSALDSDRATTAKIAHPSPPPSPPVSARVEQARLRRQKSEGLIRAASKNLDAELSSLRGDVERLVV